MHAALEVLALKLAYEPAEQPAQKAAPELQEYTVSVLPHVRAGGASKE